MKKTTFLVAGKHAVIEALKNPKRKIERVFLTEDAKKNINRENQSLNLLKNVHVFYKSKKELDNLCGRDEISHQGFIAELEQLEDLTLKDFLYQNNKKNINLIALQEVSDPRNIGSVIRSAASFKIDGLIVKERLYPDTSKTMYKASSGAIEHLNIFKVSNINSTLKFLREKNFWVYAFDNKSKEDFADISWKGNNVLLFGSEGFGLNQKTEKYVDYFVKIKINDKIDSLNISNSAAIVFHHINKNKKIT